MKNIAVIGTVVFACAFASVSEAATTKANRHSSKIHVCSTCTGSDPCNGVQELPLLQPLRKTRWDVRRLQMMKFCGYIENKMQYAKLIGQDGDGLPPATWQTA